MSSEHVRKNIPCSEFCYIDPEFCPLYKFEIGESGKKESLKMTVKRWTGESNDEINDNDDSDGTENVEIDFSNKKTPEDMTGKSDWNDPISSDIYEEQVEREHSRYSPFSCWADGSGFEFDILPDNLVGNVSSMEGLYDISYYPMDYSPFKMSDWNVWIDKFQVDYRWGQVSDQNAETILFPNVDDPWMFTEYIFQGKGSGEIIVEPTLYNDSTLNIINSDKSFIQEDSEDILDKYSREKDIVTIDDNHHCWNVKSHRVVDDWRSDYPVPDSGGKLYRVDIPVESVKWGEHGNVPPGTINMGAPKSWMDPGQNNAKIVPKFIAHIGSPFFASTYGVLYWYEKEAWIDPILLQNPITGEDGKLQMEYEIKQTGPHGVKQNTPKDVVSKPWSDQNNVRSVNIHMNNKDYVHGGCSLLKGSNGCARCAAIDAAEIGSSDMSVLQQHFSVKCGSYNPKNTSCPKFIASSQYPILADYEATASNSNEFRQKTQGTGYPASNYSTVDGIMSGSTDVYGVRYSSSSRPDTYNDKTQVNVWYEAQFYVKYESDNAVKTNKKSNSSDGFGRGTEVIRGSGKMALDTRENSDGFRGDTVFFGDMDQVSFSRWFESPMFCANSAYCNSTCGITMQQGFDPGIRAGDSKGNCRYYREKGRIACPTTGVNKRALEFQETMSRCSLFLEEIGTIWANSTDTERDYMNLTSTSYFIEKDKDYVSSRTDITNDKLWFVYALYEGNTGSDSQTDYSLEVSKIFGGLKIKNTKILTRGSGESAETRIVYLIGKIRTYNIGETDLSESYFWYDAMDNNGTVKATWFCRCDPNIHKFRYNTMIITNEKKFIGGYHPQYKDYSKRGGEYLMDIESDSYRDAMGDRIGDPSYDGQPQAVNKQGYWTDESGDYIVDEISTGLDQEINYDNEREETGSPTTISFKKSNTFINGETGETEKPKTVNCAVHANDPWILLNFYRTNGSRTATGSSGRPQYEDGNGKTYWAPPYVGDKFGIPTMRLAAHCPKCDYYISWKYHDLKCPWCGTNLERISGSTGSSEFEYESPTDVIGNTWPKEASVIKKFFKLNAIGKVQVWAPPGTCVPLDGFYWKNPTMVTNTMIRQLKYRLGDLSNGSGWTPISTMSKEKDFSMGYPEQMGYHKPSIAFESTEKDKDTIYEDIKWEGITKKDRTKYSSVNEIMPPTELPGLVTDSTNEQFIVPYTSVSDDGLKIIQAEELNLLRNRLEPVMAYVSDDVVQNDYPVLRASYEKRTTADISRYSLHTNCKVPSMILAANDSGNDAYVQFWSGDDEWGTVREYYPPGMSWWWLNQVIGSRYSSLDGGYYHMDSPDFGPGGGHRTVAKCAMFINGILPLDKEILKAYLIVNPMGEPSKDPIGRGWNGVVHWEHYHANNTDKVWDDNEKKWVCPHKEDGRIQHLHGQAGYKGIWDDNGDYHDLGWKPTGVTPMSEGGYFGWGGDSEQPESYRSIYNDKFENWRSLCGFKDVSCWSQCGEPKIDIGNTGDPVYVYKLYDSDSKTGIQNTGIEYNSRTPSKYAEDRKYKYIGLDEDRNIRMNYTTDEIWQDLTQDEFREESENAKVTIKWTVTDGNKDHEITKEFSQYSQQYVDSVYPSQMQSIAGYFDLEGINGERRLQELLDISSKTSESVVDHPIIIQTEGGSSPKYSGLTVSEQAGIIPRVMNVTPLIKELYNTRVSRSFSCKAGMSLDDVKNIDFNKDSSGNYIPKYKGTYPGELKEKKWNDKIVDDWSGDGYLLNDLHTYPKILGDNSLPDVPDDGEKYPIQEKEIEIIFEFTLPIVVNERNNRYWIVEDEKNIESIGGDDGYKGEIEQGTLYTSSQVKDSIDEMLSSKWTTSIVSDQKILAVRKQKEDEDFIGIAFINTYDSCYSLFENINTNTLYDGYVNRCIQCTSFIEEYDPKRLCEGYSWVTNSYTYFPQKAVFDLARAPLEISESNYRYTAPTVNVSNCKCPRSGCSAHDSGLTVGVWGEQHNQSMTNGQVNCPSCGQNLSNEPGAVKNPGDGLWSYEYEEKFNDNPFVTGFYVSSQYKNSFRISSRNSENDTWRALLNVEYDASSNNFTYTFNGKITSGVSEIPKEFILDKSKWFRSRYVQIEVDPLDSLESRYYSTFSTISDFFVSISGNFSNLGELNWENVSCKMNFVGNIKQSNFLTHASLNNEKTILTLYFKEALSSSNLLNLTIYPRRFYSKINKFKIFGFHYTNSQITMTGNATDKSWLFQKNRFTYQLDEYPTQILDVSIGKSQSGGISLVKTDKKDNLKYNLTKHTIYQQTDRVDENGDPIFDEKIGYSISSGNFYFDYPRNRIILPRYGYAGDKKIEVKNFEDDIQWNSYNVTYYPSNVYIRYWSGSGLPITLEAKAMGQGPSYQLEKNTIVKIENYNPKNSSDGSSSLPYNGKSEMIPDMNGNAAIRDIPWVCSNLIPSTLKYSTQMITGGKFKLPETPSTYLGKTVDNDKYFLDRFGKYNEGISGRCFTEVTFYGPPEKIISGNIIVTAPEKIDYEIDAGGNEKLKVVERTGGIAQGGFIVKLEIPERQGRATLAFSKPVLVIYARERRVDEN